jgi:hypothetical protein
MPLKHMFGQYIYRNHIPLCSLRELLPLCGRQLLANGSHHAVGWRDVCRVPNGRYNEYRMTLSTFWQRTVSLTSSWQAKPLRPDQELGWRHYPRVPVEQPHERLGRDCAMAEWGCHLGYLLASCWKTFLKSFLRCRSALDLQGRS